VISVTWIRIFIIKSLTIDIPEDRNY